MSWAEERRKDRAEEREQDRRDRRDREEAARRRREEEDERKRRERRERQQEARRRRSDRRDRRAKLLAQLASEGDTVAALIVMACAIGPALYFQVAALVGVPGLPVVIAVALAVMLEAGAWVATVAGERAKREGRPVGIFRAAMWGCAFVAAVINWSHAPDSGGGWLAWVLAAASLGGVAFWELRGLGRHRGKSTRTKQQRAEEKARRKHERKRRRVRDVWKRHEEILAAHPYGTVRPEDAWAQAWEDVKAAPLGVTARVLARRLQATAEVEEVLADAERTPESLAVDALLADLFPAHGRGDEGTGGTPLRGPSGDPPKDGPKAATTLGRKGKEGSGRASAKTPQKPLAEADLEKVRKLADALGGAEKLSARNVREVLGGGANEYAIRVRDAVKQERGAL